MKPLLEWGSVLATVGPGATSHPQPPSWARLPGWRPWARPWTQDSRMLDSSFQKRRGPKPCTCPFPHLLLPELTDCFATVTGVTQHLAPQSPKQAAGRARELSYGDRPGSGLLFSICPAPSLLGPAGINLVFSTPHGAPTPLSSLPGPLSSICAVTVKPLLPGAETPSLPCLIRSPPSAEVPVGLPQDLCPLPGPSA